MYGMKRPGGVEKHRIRILSDDEIVSLWAVRNSPQTPSKVISDVLMLILSTAQRPGEVLSMKWDELDLEAGVWRQTDNKPKMNLKITAKLNNWADTKLKAIQF